MDGLNTLMYAQINAAGIVLLLLFLNNMNRNGHRDMPLDQRIFKALMGMNILIFLLDTGMWLLDGTRFPLSGVLMNFVTLLYYIGNPLICFLWLMYTDYKIHESRRRLRKRAFLYVIPCGISAALSVVSLFTGWLFALDGDNAYSRGPYFWVMAVSALFYLGLSFLMSLKDIRVNGWEENRTVSVHLVLFPIGIILASVIQILFYGVSIIWVCTMIALASIYINIQNVEIHTDFLTGLYNRRWLDEHFQRRLKMRRPEQQLFAVMIDLDDFKGINDRYGHAAGDDALKKLSGILRQACKGSDDAIARLGGDEFIILGERAETGEIIKLMDAISASALAFNAQHQSPYLLLPSMGHSIYSKEDTDSSFFAAADRAMYRNKQERKALRPEQAI